MLDPETFESLAVGDVIEAPSLLPGLCSKHTRLTVTEIYFSRETSKPYFIRFDLRFSGIQIEEVYCKHKKDGLKWHTQ